MRFLNSAADRYFNQVVVDFFLNELLACRSGSGYNFYLISPWISDVAFDMSGRNIFYSFFPGGQATLLDVLKKMLDLGGGVKVASLLTGSRDPAELGTLEFLRQLSQAGAGRHLQISLFKDLHAKIYVGRAGGLVGSPNITQNGVFNYKEFAVHFSEENLIDELALHARAIWGCESGRVPFPGGAI